MRILVTGGAGFIGANLAKRLEREGYETVVLDNFSSGSFTNLADFQGDVISGTCHGSGFVMQTGTGGGTAGGASGEPCRRCDVIFHEASITDTTVTDQLLMMRNNVEGFRNVLTWAARWDAPVVWASSASIYGNSPAPNKISDKPAPLNVYAYSKLAMERLARLWAKEHAAIPIVGLRYFNVYGPGEAHKGKFASMIWQLALQMKAGKRPRIFKMGDQKRDFVSCDDVVEANLLAMKRVTARGGTGAEVFNAGCGKPHSFNEVVAALNEALGTRLEAEYFDNPYSFTQDHTEADISETQRVLGYRPRHGDIREGVKAYVGAVWPK